MPLYRPELGDRIEFSCRTPLVLSNTCSIPGGWGAVETPSVDDCIAGFLDVIALSRVQENLARAGTVLAYCDVLEMRLEAAESDGGDPGETVRGALCDLAVTMTGTSRCVGDARCRRAFTSNAVDGLAFRDRQLRLVDGSHHNLGVASRQ